MLLIWFQGPSQKRKNVYVRLIVLFRVWYQEILALVEIPCMILSEDWFANHPAADSPHARGLITSSASSPTGLIILLPSFFKTPFFLYLSCHCSFLSTVCPSPPSLPWVSQAKSSAATWRFFFLRIRANALWLQNHPVKSNYVSISWSIVCQYSFLLYMTCHDTWHSWLKYDVFQSVKNPGHRCTETHHPCSFERATANGETLTFICTCLWL